MRAISQYTITNLCDVVTSDVPPLNPYMGQLWVDTSTTPPETKIWNGTDWVLENAMDYVRVTVETLNTKSAQFQQSVDGLNSYVANITQTVETITDELGESEQRVLEAESRISELEHTVDGLTVSVQRQFVGGVNFIQNSSGLNGITDDWTYTGTVSVDSSTDVQNNTTADSAFKLGTTSTLQQKITGLVTGTSYVISLRAKKTKASYSSYIRMTYNGNKQVDLFNTTAIFGWTEYSVLLPDVQDSTITLYIYNRYADLYVADIMMAEGTAVHKWTPAPNEIYTNEVKIDKRGIEVSNSGSSQRTVITNTEFAGYYEDEVIFTLNKDETQTKKTTVDGELTVGKTKFVPMANASQGLNIVILD